MVKKKCNHKKELAIGSKIELEHSKHFPKNLQKSIARRIAQDHIKESPCYYRELIKMEKRLKKK